MGAKWIPVCAKWIPVIAKWPQGDGEVVNGLLGQHTKRLCFTSPGGTLAPAGPAVIHLVSGNPIWGTSGRHVAPG